MIWCTVCWTPFPVGSDDPDAALDEAAQHVRRVHRRYVSEEPELLVEDAKIGTEL